jgi:hypothetical protein
MAENGFVENCFDIIIDKGCLDCIETGFSDAIKEIYHSLNIDGVFYHVSIAKPAKRVSLLTDSEFRIKLDVEEIIVESEESSEISSEDYIYYIYKVTKVS